MRTLLLLLVSILPVYLIGHYIYNKDKDKEPKRLIIKLFFGGIGSFVLTIFSTLLLSIFFPSLLSDPLDLDLFDLFFHAFLGVALVEELSKWIFVYKVSFNNREYDQIYDMIVYSVFVALGFACIENIFYVFSNGFRVGIIRGLLAVPGHACDGVFMGYFLSLAKISYVKNDFSSMRKNFFLSILVPVLLHGFYDYCLFSQRVIFIGLFFIFIVSLYIVTIGKITKVSKFGKIKYRNNFCSYCGRRVDSDFCPDCGGRNE